MHETGDHSSEERLIASVELKDWFMLLEVLQEGNLANVLQAITALQQALVESGIQVNEPIEDPDTLLERLEGSEHELLMGIAVLVRDSIKAGICIIQGVELKPTDLQKPIEGLGLSYHTKTRLLEKKIVTVADILLRPHDELAAEPDVGTVHINQINDALTLVFSLNWKEFTDSDRLKIQKALSVPSEEGNEEDTPDVQEEVQWGQVQGLDTDLATEIENDESIDFIKGKMKSELAAIHCTSIADLLKKPYAEIEALPEFGPKSLKVLKSIIHKNTGIRWELVSDVERRSLEQYLEERTKS